VADGPSRRTLFVSTRPGWPAEAGYALRTHALISGLVANSTCHVLFVAPHDEERELAPAHEGKLTSAVTPVARNGAARTICNWLLTGRPRGWARVEWQSARTEVARQIQSGSYDNVLVSGIDGWQTVPATERPSVIVDLDDLESAKIKHRVANRAAAYNGVRGRIMAAADRIDLRRWLRIEAEIVRDALAVVVCSDHDRDLLKSAKVYTVPNTYPCAKSLTDKSPTADPTAAEGQSPPILLFVGSLTTRPNEEACRLMVDSIMPLVWRQDPDVQLRLVGRHSETVARLHAPPRVVVTGFVEDLESELVKADVVVAPFISGGGTRIKILEAFRAGRPVVSTSIGIEGIDATDGVHALIRNEPAAFANACLTILHDPQMAEEIAAAACDLAEDRYSPRAVAHALATLFGAT
jgi:glycosyltransferase involved in cell wall biosynthesis